MASANHKVLGVVLGAALLSGAFMVVYQTVLGPREEEQRVRAEVATYAAAWTALRACIVGPTPAARSGSDAIQARALLEPALENVLRACDPLVRALERPSRDHAGPEAEAAWLLTTRAASKLIEAHAIAAHASDARKAGAVLGDDASLLAALGPTIDALDTEIATLLRVTGSPALPPPGGAIAALEAKPVVDSKGVPLPAHLTEANHGVLLGDVASGVSSVLYRQEIGQQLERFVVAEDALIATDGSFGLWLEDDEAGGAKILVAGALDVQGDPSGEGVELAKAGPGGLEAAFALGGTHRLAAWKAFENDGDARWELARSADGGKTWPERFSLPPGRGSSWRDFGRRRLDVLRELPAGIAWLSVREDQPTAPLEARVVGPSSWGATMDDACFAGAALFLPTAAGLFKIEPGHSPRPIAGWPAGRAITTCDAERVVSLDRGDGAAIATTCTESACETSRVPLAVGGAVHVAIAGREVVLVTTLGDLASLWTGGADPHPTLYRLPARCAVLDVTANASGIVAALRCPQDNRLAPLSPAKGKP